jgi:hypothetical protein
MAPGKAGIHWENTLVSGLNPADRCLAFGALIPLTWARNTKMVTEDRADAV